MPAPFVQPPSASFEIVSTLTLNTNANNNNQQQITTINHKHIQNNQTNSVDTGAADTPLPKPDNPKTDRASVYRWGPRRGYPQEGGRAALYMNMLHVCCR